MNHGRTALELLKAYVATTVAAGYMLCARPGKGKKKKGLDVIFSLIFLQTSESESQCESRTNSATFGNEESHLAKLFNDNKFTHAENIIVKSIGCHRLFDR